MHLRDLCRLSTVLALCCGHVFRSVEAQSPPTATLAAKQDSALQQELGRIAAAHHGHVAMFAEHLNTGEVVALDADRPVQTASVIKLTILLEAMEEIRAGRAQWSEKLTMVPGDGVSGSGVLAQLDAPLTMTLKDVLTLMIVLSDNTATNLAIDRFGVDAVNARMAAMGYEQTHLYKKIGKPASGPMPADQPKFGLGKTTAREMAKVLERIGRCELGGPNERPAATDLGICAVALTMLRNQFFREGIPRYLEALDASEEGSAIANKTGALDAVRADVAIVAAKSGPIVLSIFTYGNIDQGWTVDSEAELSIARLAQAVVKAWAPEGLEAKRLVPGLGLTARPPLRTLNGDKAAMSRSQ